MKIFNITKRQWIAENAACADTAVKRLVGLLGKSTLSPGEALVIRPCQAVHTWFMRFSIDCLFVDQEGKIVHLICDLAPWRFSPFIKNAACVIELPPHTISATGTEIGDRLEMTKS
ncbi:DUF192 domain-containing protein [Brevibacillus composti]|uniref:DUF192 domain-containing protein n=1 Tax=Brevibacillus composti TaxID=2796470 RepID=A0A7T5ELJ0_9BACL|nr:DUF192 domain-containing protein [Brevibacillus composti]QQE74766.1 DUF192 domain-containing protein [Brevibacillus composti]QUO41851.1 DUF192 domain-containing protein [Brevibacillus composti]